MSDEKRLKRIIDWLEFSLENQNQLLMEMEYFPFPQWNSGYLECLNDLKEIIESDTMVSA